LLTKLGAIAVDRSASAGLVEQMVAEFRRQDQLILGIAPEGTRGKVGQWKMGFLHIARQADVPLLLIRMDYQKKRVTIGPELNASENPQEDLLRIQALCRDVVARRPTNA
jgi:1-acyl-sn-glycerol-3-phosphate acyltransferase